MIKKYMLYLVRWQLSTPILAGVLFLLSGYGELAATVVANLVGGLIFFWIDRYIFKVGYINPLWEIKEDVTCSDCGEVCQGYRLVKTKNYDRLNDPEPEFRCQRCSRLKSETLRNRGIAM